MLITDIILLKPKTTILKAHRKFLMEQILSRKGNFLPGFKTVN